MIEVKGCICPETVKMQCQVAFGCTERRQMEELTSKFIHQAFINIASCRWRLSVSIGLFNKSHPGSGVTGPASGFLTLLSFYNLISLLNHRRQNWLHQTTAFQIRRPSRLTCCLVWICTTALSCRLIRNRYTTQEGCGFDSQGRPLSECMLSEWVLSRYQTDCQLWIGLSLFRWKILTFPLSVFWCFTVWL